jgi:hypothetical protein
VSKKSSSITKARASSRSDESSCSSSGVDSQASQSTYRDDRAEIVPPVLHAAPQGSVFQYFDQIPLSYVNYEAQSSNVQDLVSLSSLSVQRYSDEATTQIVSTEQADAMYRYAADTTSVAAQPFNDDDLMYLASIFEKDDGDLSSILSLDQESSVEDFSFNLWR